MTAKRRKSIREALIAEITNSPVSRYMISKVTKIPQSVLSKFVNGQGISLATIERLVGFFDLQLVNVRRDGPFFNDEDEPKKAKRKRK